MHYGVNGVNLPRQYKEIFNGYRDWKQQAHADEYVLYPQNIGPNLAIDESSLSCGELYTFATNRDAHGGKGALVAAMTANTTVRSLFLQYYSKLNGVQSYMVTALHLILYKYRRLANGLRFYAAF